MPNKMLYLDCLNHVLDYRIYNSSENSKFSCLIIIVHERIMIMPTRQIKYYNFVQKEVSEMVKRHATRESFQFSFLQINKAVWFKTVEICLRIFLTFWFYFDCIKSELYKKLLVLVN